MSQEFEAGQEIKLAYLQSAVTIPGLFSTMTTLDEVKTPKLRMRLVARGLLVTQDNVTAFIPQTNIKICVFKHG